MIPGVGNEKSRMLISMFAGLCVHFHFMIILMLITKGYDQDHRAKIQINGLKKALFMHKNT